MKYIDEEMEDAVIRKGKNKKQTEFKKLMRKLKKYELFWLTEDKRKRIV